MWKEPGEVNANQIEDYFTLLFSCRKNTCMR